jgi:Uma2 family endonuclease
MNDTSRMKERPPTTEVYDRREAPRTPGLRRVGSLEEARVVLHGIEWKDYEQIGEALRDRAGLRLTYELGTLEIMTTSNRHERLKKCFARYLEMIIDGLGMEMEVGGSMTFKQTGERGLEPDECYWIQNAAKVRGCDYDPELHPPPDLIVEIEVSRSALSRMGLFASLKVPEVWRYRAKRLTIHRLHLSGEYRVVKKSKALPQLDVRVLPRFVEDGMESGYQVGARRVQAWLRPIAQKQNEE